jgi:4'-phosphopantetheinyl transferase EntD
MPDLATALRAVLPPGVVLGVGRHEPLWPGEHLENAVPARRAEFALGRSAARAAMRALGVPAAPVPMNPDRSPRWPAGLTGSISHCQGACFAILGQSGAYAGLGLDLEPARPLDPDLWPVILLPQDTADPLAVFVAKEAVYKAQFAVTRILFDFHALAVTLTGDRFEATFQRQVGPFAPGDVLDGHLVRTSKHTAAVCAITAS